jgi:hypothetical protein
MLCVGAAAGKQVRLTDLTSTTGRLWIAGMVPSGGFSLATARLELGKQDYAWLLVRDETRVAVSLRLAAVPSVKLWNTINLDFA